MTTSLIVALAVGVAAIVAAFVFLSWVEAVLIALVLVGFVWWTRDRARSDA
jgi:hypothetical protein